ncbi:MAG: energy-coupling factor ABC transporter permease [Pyrobaculum sp.]|uniref:energy-coupling factor ABC transporter permease n=1 Tax=Pyrobaculum sp. TaxID=2004705 RepID=UPI003EEC1DD4
MTDVHIPDGYLDPYMAGATWLIAAIYLYFAVRKTPRDLLPRVSAVAGAIFVAQMLNWPIPGGTSLHFVGGAFAAMYLNSPWAAGIAIALVLAVQTLLFHDGGITAYGANVLNMGVVYVWIGWALWKLLERRYPLAGAFLGGWLGIFIAGTAAGLEIGLMPTIGYPLSITIPAMAIPHFLLGIVEGAITVALVATLRRYGMMPAQIPVLAAKPRP